MAGGVTCREECELATIGVWWAGSSKAESASWLCGCKGTGQAGTECAAPKCSPTYGAGYHSGRIVTSIVEAQFVSAEVSQSEFQVMAPRPCVCCHATACTAVPQGP